MRIFLLLSFVFCTTTTHAQRTILTNDTLPYYIISSIDVQGNKKTKGYIIKRELQFKIGDTIPYQGLMACIEKSRQNVFNTTLFTEVDIIAASTVNNSKELRIVIDVHERWYAIPSPVISFYDRNYKVWSKVYDSDLSRVRLGVKVKHINVTGRSDEAIVNLVTGFSKEFLLKYSFPFLDKKLHWGFSTDIGYLSKKGAIYIDSANTGLPRKVCATCATPDFNLFRSKEFISRVGVSYSKKQYDRQELSIGYINVQASDTVVGSNPNYFSNQKNSFSFVEAKYTFTYLKVDYFSYPLKGFGVFFTLSHRFAPSGLHQTFIELKGKWEKPLAKKLYYFYSGGMTTRLYKNQSFYNLRSTNTASANIRGYEQYLFLAKSDFGMRNNVAYEFFNRKLRMPIKTKLSKTLPIKLYARTFFDLGYFTVPQAHYNNFNNKLIYSGGLALDIVTLFDYAVRIEISNNKHAGISFFMR